MHAESVSPADLQAIQATLLLVDVVDSTRCAERLGDAAMARLWAEHDRAARDLLAVWRGREIDKSDGFLLLFDAATDALRFALSYHRALAGLSMPLAARAGLHTDQVLLRQNPPEDVARGAKPVEVEGLAKPVAARVMALARGGQTLLTAATHSALAPWQGTALRLHSHGHWQLKGLDAPVELFEAGEEDTVFAALDDGGKGWHVQRVNDLWLPLDLSQHSLPAERDGFIGRQPALAELAQRLTQGARLVTLLGIGGTGKTRLVQRFGWTQLAGYPGGVWFCDLSPARSLDGVVHAVALGLNLPLGRADPLQQIGRALAGRGRCLLILDNFEQVARDAEASVGHWLDAAPEARVIVTSREVLNIVGEQTMALPPLGAVDGVALFKQRAAAAKAGFKSGPGDDAAIDALVQLLDGLPLAIELAAARTPVLSPRRLLQRMGDRFHLLSSAGGRRDRQATLRAALDWSWDLLSPAERAALAQLSVFEGGFTLDAAEAVLDLNDCIDAPWAVDAVQALLQKSLLRGMAGERFDLLVSVREYAAEHLAAPDRFPGSGPAAPAAAWARHWRYYATFDESAANAGGGAEIDNLVVACRRATLGGDAAAAVATLVAAWAVLRLRGPFTVAATLASASRSMRGLGDAQRATVEWVAGSALDAAGRAGESRPCFDVGLQLAQASGDRHRMAHLLCNLGVLNTTEGRLDEARAQLERALALGDVLGQPLLLIRAHNGLGAAANDQGDSAGAGEHWQAALALARQTGDQRWEGGLLGNLAGLALGQGRHAQARADFSEALALARATGDRRWEGNVSCNLGLLDHEMGRPVEALQHLDVALGIARQHGLLRLECIALCNLGIVTASQGALDAALQHQQQALAIAQRLHDRRSEGQIRGQLGLVLARQGQFNEARDCLNKGEALLRTLGDNASLALLLCSRAEAEWQAGVPVAAEDALLQAKSLAPAKVPHDDSELGGALSRASALLSGGVLS